jgi:hypothetical protein
MTDELRVTGTPGVLKITTSLQSPRFEGRLRRLELNMVTQVLDAIGEVEIISFPNHRNSRAQFSGSRKEGVATGGILFHGGGRERADEVGELSHVSLFGLDTSSLPELARLRRLEPWWPSERWPESRRQALARAHAMTMTARNSAQVRAQRAQFWGKVSGMLHEKGATGHSQAVARELALDTRRRAAATWSPERIWLTISRALGYGTKVLQPVLLWTLLAMLVAVLLVLSVEDWEIGRLISPSLAAVWFNLLVSPFQLLRPLAVPTALTEVAGIGTLQQAINLPGARGGHGGIRVLSGCRGAAHSRTRA